MEAIVADANEICGHCGEPATGNAITQIKGKPVRVCETPQPPFTVSCLKLITEEQHGTNCECWKLYQALTNIGHYAYCIMDDSPLALQWRGSMDSPQCAPDCMKNRTAIADAFVHDPHIVINRHTPIEIIGQKVQKLPRGARRTGRPAVKLEPALQDLTTPPPVPALETNGAPDPATGPVAIGSPA